MERIARVDLSMSTDVANSEAQAPERVPVSVSTPRCHSPDRVRPMFAALGSRGPEVVEIARSLKGTAYVAEDGQREPAFTSLVLGEDRDLAVNGLDSRPVPAPLISAARQLLAPAHLPTDTSESA